VTVAEFKAPPRTGFLSLAEIGMAVGGAWSRSLDAALARQATSGVSTDSRVAQECGPGALFIALKGDRFDGHDALGEAASRGCIAAMVSRVVEGAPTPQLVVPDTLAAFQRLASAWRAQLTATVVAVTGSAGKTTTHRLLAAAMSHAGNTCASPKSFNNQIGVPISVCRCPRDAAYLVAEIGTNHPGEVAALGAIVRPHVAVITNAGQVHLEGLGDLDGVIREKSSLAGCVEPGGIVVAPIDQPALYDAVVSHHHRVIPFGSEAAGAAGVGVVGRRPTESGQMVDALAFGARVTMELQLHGAHNARNACAALAAAVAVGVPVADAARGMSSVVPADMRMVREDLGWCTLFNDAYNANPEAMQASLSTFAELAPASRRVAVLGEMRELGPGSAAFHAEVGAIAAAHASVCIFVGGDTRHGAAAAARAGARSHSFKSLNDQTVAHIRALLKDGDAVLVKGSRGAAMERFIEGLRRSGGSGARAGATPGGGTGKTD